MSNPRKIGLKFVNEVKKVLQGLGHEVEGPGNKVIWLPSGPIPIHADFFGCFDLISYFEGQFIGHQVSTLSNKAAKVKLIQGKNMPGWVWARVDDIKIFYRVFIISQEGEIEEGQIQWKV